MTKENLTVEMQKETNKKQATSNKTFLYITLFRNSVFLNKIQSKSLIESQNIWIKERINYLNKNKEKNNLYQFSEFKTEEDDYATALRERKNLFCFSHSIREFYLNTICVLEPKTTLYSLFYMAEGGIFTSQIEADSMEKACELFRENTPDFESLLEDKEKYYELLYRLTSQNKTKFIEKIASLFNIKEIESLLLENKEKYYRFLYYNKNFLKYSYLKYEDICDSENYTNYIIKQKILPYIEIATMNANKTTVKINKGNKNELRFSQKNYTILIVPTGKI